MALVRYTIIEHNYDSFNYEIVLAHNPNHTKELVCVHRPHRETVFYKVRHIELVFKGFEESLDQEWIEDIFESFEFAISKYNQIQFQYIAKCEEYNI